MARVPSRPESVNSNDSGFHPRTSSGRWGSDKANISGTRYKICFGGKANVGKTSIFHRLKGDGFCEEKRVGHVSTYEYLDEEDEKIEYSIWDTNGFEEHNSMTLQGHYKSAHCVLLVYDVTDFSSLEYIASEIDYIEKRSLAPNLRYVLIQNKIDKESWKFIPSERQIDFISKSCIHTKVHMYLQTSAKENTGIEELKNKLKYLLQLPAEELDQDKTTQSFKKMLDEKMKKKKNKLSKCKQM